MNQTSPVVDQVNKVIQEGLRKKELKVVDPVTATKWLIKAGLRKKMESRPGAYLRSLCRQGKIKRAEKVGDNWKIHGTK